MKQFLRTLFVIVLALTLFGEGDAKPKKKNTGCDKGKQNITCPTASALKQGIRKCPDTGCGLLDPALNQQKNIATSNEAPKDMTFQGLAALPKKVPGYNHIGDPRQPLIDQGEGKMIRVVAWALAARKGSKESCNCRLGQAENTDNHIVLVDDATLKFRARATPAEPPSAAHPKGVKAKTAAQNTLKKREAQSQTAEFTPRVRLTHPKLVGADLQKLIVANGGKLHVRITGLQMYDSEHAVGCHKLLRHTDWEIHPVFGLEYCPKNKKCTRDSDANWVDLEQQ
jgi:hypothetical protein